MCLIAFAWDCHPSYRLILGANRDEYRRRPTQPAHFWGQAPHVLAGRDLQAGGTWLGITTNGKLAAVTNYRDARQQVQSPHSRGSLVADFLIDQSMDAHALHEALAATSNQYDGFNLLYGTVDQLLYFTNRGGSSGPVQPGIHALSNHLLDSPWPKVTAAKARLAEVLRQDDVNPEDLFALLADPQPFADRALPDTGIGLERERLLSPLFINGSAYGTRSTTVILIERDGHVQFRERSYDSAALPVQTAQFSFRIAPG